MLIETIQEYTMRQAKEPIYLISPSAFYSITLSPPFQKSRENTEYFQVGLKVMQNLHKYLKFNKSIQGSFAKLRVFTRGTHEFGKQHCVPPHRFFASIGKKVVKVHENTPRVFNLLKLEFCWEH